MELILMATSLLFGGISLALWIKFKAANHTAKALLDKLKNTATDLDETKRNLASVNLTLDAMRVERTADAFSQSSNGSASKEKSNNSPENKKRKYYRKPKN